MQKEAFIQAVRARMQKYSHQPPGRELATSCGAPLVGGDAPLPSATTTVVATLMMFLHGAPFSLLCVLLVLFFHGLNPTFWRFCSDVTRDC